MNHLNDTNDTNPPDPFAAFVAVDWADEKHAFTLQAAGQKKQESGTLEQKPERIGAWVATLRERFGGRPVAVAVEQSRGALIHALLNYDFLVIFPIHPPTVARFREAFRFRGVKSDPLDTGQILEILTKHLDLLKPLHPDTEATRLLARLVGGSAQGRRTARQPHPGAQGLAQGILSPGAGNLERQRHLAPGA